MGVAVAAELGSVRSAEGPLGAEGGGKLRSYLILINTIAVSANIIPATFQ